MSEWSVQFIANWGWVIFAAPLVLGFIPQAAIHLVVLIYPKGDLRRQEYVAEICAVPYSRRLLWIADQCALALVTGVPLRLRAAINPPRISRASCDPSASSAVTFVHFTPGDQPQFERVFDSLAPRLYSFAKHLNPASAEDVLQTVFIRLWDHGGYIRDTELIDWMLEAVACESQGQRGG